MYNDHRNNLGEISSTYQKSLSAKPINLSSDLQNYESSFLFC